YYIFLARKSELHHNEKDMEEFIKRGLKRYPDHPLLNKYLAQLYSDQKKWKQSIPFWDTYFNNTKDTCPASEYAQFVTALEKRGDIRSMEDYVLEGLEFYPDNKELNKKYYKAAMMAGKWEAAINRLEKYIASFQSERPYNELIHLSVMQQLSGNHQKANQILSRVLEKYKAELKNDKSGYRKIRIFDNGETVIDFYKQLRKSNTIIITFDSINKVLKKEPFGFKVLNEQKVDILAVRKRKAGMNHQDLSKKEFEKAARGLVDGYEDK